jgi:orotate phosphoribosyltransferase
MCHHAASHRTKELTQLSELRTQVIDIVRQRGLRHLPEPVQLASGAYSRDFIDGKEALANGADLETACRALLEMVTAAGVEFDAIGGLTMGADQFAHVVAVLAPCRWFVVRKQPKGRGTNKRVEGCALGPDVRVLLVDDVVTTGGSIRDAYEVVSAEGGIVVGAVTLVDRGDHTRPYFADKGVPYLSLVTYRDLGIDPVGDGLISA